MYWLMLHWLVTYEIKSFHLWICPTFMGLLETNKEQLQIKIFQHISDLTKNYRLFLEKQNKRFPSLDTIQVFLIIKLEGQMDHKTDLT